MVRAIALFELTNGARRISTYIYFVLFLAFGYLMFVAAAGAFAGVNLGLGTGGKVFANSPYLLFAFISSLSFYGLLVVAAVMGYSGQQDFQHQTYPLVFTEPISKLQYLAGRFIAANILLLFIFLELGAMVGIYFKTNRLPVQFLLYVAITVMTRSLASSLNIMDMTDQHLLTITGAILMLAIAVLVLRYGSHLYPSHHVPRIETAADNPEGA